MAFRRGLRIVGAVVLCGALVALGWVARDCCDLIEAGLSARQGQPSPPAPLPFRERGERQQSRAGSPTYGNVLGSSAHSIMSGKAKSPAVPATAPPTPGPARLVFVGDVLPLQDRNYLGNVKAFIAGADLAVCNLECVLSTHGAKTPLKFKNGRVIRNEFFFQVAPAHGNRLAAAGFDVTTLANNHIMDYGGEALLESLDVLDAAGIEHTGAGRDKWAARKPVICEVQGQTVAVLAYVSPNTLPGTESFAATEHTAGTTFVKPGPNAKPTAQTCAMLRNDISAARKKADFVVVCYHWGREARREPDEFPKHLAHLSVDCGADLVIGHHPHTPQGIEIYKDRPIAYSLGNFVFPTKWKGLLESIMLEVRIEDGRWTKIVAYPVTLQHLLGDPTPTTGEAGHKTAGRIASMSAPWKTPCRYVQDNQTTALIIENSDREEVARDYLLKAEVRCFYAEAYDESGWKPDLREDEKKPDLREDEKKPDLREDERKPDLRERKRNANIEGLSTVHFLAWDLEGGVKSPKAREIVVASKLAAEVQEIFKEIYLDEERFPIHDLVGYNYRTIAGGQGLSKHAFGRAIDINRVENPMIKGGKKIVHPDEPPYVPGEWRPGEDPYSIAPDGAVVRIFKAHGWRWGGDWTSCKDYQHFDK